MNNEKLAWLAGIIDGEGCIQMIMGHDKKNNNKPFIRCKFTITNTCQILLDECEEILEDLGIKATKYVHPSGKKFGYNWKERTQLTIQNRVELRQLLITVVPYLISKKKVAELMLEHLERPIGIEYVPRDWEIFKEVKLKTKRGL